MKKINLTIDDISCSYSVKTHTETLAVLEDIQHPKTNPREDEAVVHFAASRIAITNLTTAIAKAGFKVVKRAAHLSLSLIGGILIMLFSITGCSDTPHTGPMLTIDRIDRYLDATGEDTVCLQDGFDSVCLKLLPGEGGEGAIGGSDAPIVHVHPTSIVYEFYHENRLILSAEQAMDTTEIVEDLINAGRIQLPPDINNLSAGGAQGNGDNTFGKWIIKMYYSDAFPEARRGLGPRTSGFDIRVVEGMKILPFTRRDLEIRDFKQINEIDGTRGVQFAVETESVEIAIQVGGLVPDHTATFHISADSVASDEGTNTFELEPLQ